MSKFINWNVNGLRAILSKGDLEKLIEDEKPDILSLYLRSQSSKIIHYGKMPFKRISLG